MIKIITLPLGQLETNCYLVTCSETGATIIIDPADQGDLISQKILTEKLTPIAIILTHGHFDHVLALLETKLNFSLPIYLHPADSKLLSQAGKSATHWLGISTDPVPPADRPLKDKQVIKIGHKTLKVIYTPGHTPGSICLYSPPHLFTGDTLFKEGIGRTDFSYSSPLQLTKSLKKLFKLPPETIIYPGHGDPSTLSAEIKLNETSPRVS